jgi:hypothetical protein
MHNCTLMILKGNLQESLRASTFRLELYKLLTYIYSCSVYLVIQLRETTTFLKSRQSVSYSRHSLPSTEPHRSVTWTPLNPTLNNLQSVHTVTRDMFKTHFNISLPFTCIPRSPVSLSSSHITTRHIPEVGNPVYFHQVFRLNFILWIFFVPCVLRVSPISPSLIWTP